MEPAGPSQTTHKIGVFHQRLLLIASQHLESCPLDEEPLVAVGHAEPPHP
jgi:hypothetical protein